MTRVGVVGAGPMGRLHARTVRRLADQGSEFELACVFDRHRGRAESLAKDYAAQASDDLASFASQVDAAIVAVPTTAHGGVGIRLLEQGIDVLVEKPMAASVQEGEALVKTARAGHRILQVGHVEWYNPVLREALSRVGDLRRILVDRLQPASDRGGDIDVIQDLMLHDLDWVSRHVGSRLSDVHADGRVVETDRFDEVEAHLVFECGAEAVLRASRVHKDRRRRVRLEGESRRFTVDLDGGSLVRGSSNAAVGIGNHASDPLEAQWISFMDSCRSRVEPTNGGDVGIASLCLVDRVREAISSNPETVYSTSANSGSLGFDDDTRFRG